MNASSYTLPKHPHMWRGLVAMSDMNVWEREHLAFMGTPTGRDLYFLLAKRFLFHEEPSAMHLKTLVVGSTDRAMRLRVRQFEQLGLITITQNKTDARIRNVEPTQKLLDMFDAHTMAMREIFGHHFVFSQHATAHQAR